MTSVQQLTLGPDPAPLQQGRSAHGRWRTAHQEAGTQPEDGESRPAALRLVQDNDRLAFALAEGPAAKLLADRLVDYLWTRESAGADWPQELREWLADKTEWSDAPPGRNGFICGRLERNLPGGRVYLAWLGMSGIRLLDRVGDTVTLDTVITADEAWTARRGPEPVGMALHAYRGSLFGLDRLLVFTGAAAPIGEELPDLAQAELSRALVDWGEEAEHDLAFLDLRFNPVLTEPDTVVLSYRWIAADRCELSWPPAVSATAYRIEEASTPAFDDATLVAELTDTRQMRYELSPPASSPRFYRVVPLNQGVTGQPSEPVSPTPITLIAPLLEPVAWSADGGYILRWTPITQATSYEVQSCPQADFHESETEIVYRGELAETYLPAETAPNLFYRVRAINVLYAPQNPSPWSQPQRAPLRLETPHFSEVTQRRLIWEAVPGARQYAVRITPQGTPEGEDEEAGEDFLTAETRMPAADQPATYRVRAFRQPGDQRTASEWSEPVTVTPPRGESAARAPDPRLITPLVIGAALVALVIGLALGGLGLDYVQDANATSTRTPLPKALIEATGTAQAVNLQNATAVVEQETAVAGLDEANAALSQQNESLNEANAVLDDANATLAAQNTGLSDTNEVLETEAAALEGDNATLTAENQTLNNNNQSLRDTIGMLFDENEVLQATLEAEQQARDVATATAAVWTATPTITSTPLPTETPDARATVAAELTITAESWTATPAPTETPDARATVAAELTATAESWTATPLPTETPDARATVAAELTATAESWTATPDPRQTVAALNATIAAYDAAYPLETCFLIGSAEEPLPAYPRRVPVGEPLIDAVPRFVPVTGWSLRPDSDTGAEVLNWVRVLVEIDGETVTGWVQAPAGARLDAWVGGPDCDLAAGEIVP